MADDVSTPAPPGAPAPLWHAFTQLGLVVVIFGILLLAALSWG